MVNQPSLFIWYRSHSCRTKVVHFSWISNFMVTGQHISRNTTRTPSWCIVGDLSRTWPKCSLFNSFYNEVRGRALLLSLVCSTLSLIRTLYCWELSKKIPITIFKIFGLTWPGTEPRSPGPLANTLPTGPTWWYRLQKLYLCRSVRLPQGMFCGSFDWVCRILRLQPRRGVQLPKRVSLIWH